MDALAASPSILRGFEEYVNSGTENRASVFSEIPTVTQQESVEVFASFIATSKDYLESLANLGDDWISGSKSYPPGKDVLRLGKKILDSLLDVFSHSFEFSESDCPKITLGPIPKGGLAMDLDFKNGAIVYVSLFNDETVHIETDENGYFSDLEADKKSIERMVSEVLAKYSAWNRYS